MHLFYIFDLPIKQVQVTKFKYLTSVHYCLSATRRPIRKCLCLCSYIRVHTGIRKHIHSIVYEEHILQITRTSDWVPSYRCYCMTLCLAKSQIVDSVVNLLVTCYLYDAWKIVQLSPCTTTDISCAWRPVALQGIKLILRASSNEPVGTVMMKALKCL